MKLFGKPSKKDLQKKIKRLEKNLTFYIYAYSEGQVKNLAYKRALEEILDATHWVDSHPGRPSKKMLNGVSAEKWESWQALLHD